MKRKSSISLGPGAPSLILIFVVLALSMLSMLALMTGRNDHRLSNRSIEVMQSVYALNDTAEQTRAELDAILAEASQAAAGEEAYLAQIRSQLPAGAELVGREIVWTETDGFRNLHCAIEILPLGSEQRETWSCHTLTAIVAEETEDNGLVEFD